MIGRPPEQWRALHDAEAQALSWRKLAEDLGRVLTLARDRKLLDADLTRRAEKLLARVERADGREA